MWWEDGEQRGGGKLFVFAIFVLSFYKVFNLGKRLINIVQNETITNSRKPVDTSNNNTNQREITQFNQNQSIPHTILQYQTKQQHNHNYLTIALQ